MHASWQTHSDWVEREGGLQQRLLVSRRNDLVGYAHASWSVVRVDAPVVKSERLVRGDVDEALLPPLVCAVGCELFEQLLL